MKLYDQGKRQAVDIYSRHHYARHGNVIYLCQCYSIPASAVHKYNVVHCKT